MSHLEVTFRRKTKSQTQFVMRFECGEANGLLILETAWKHNAEIVATRPYSRS